MRIFISFPVPEDVAQHLVSVEHRLDQLYPRMPARFVKRELLHVTLEFIGDMSEERVRELDRLLAVLSSEVPATPVWLDYLDGFPDLAHPRVIIVHVGEEHRVLQRFHDRLQIELAANAFDPPKEHEWRPHITIARLRSAWDCPNDLREAGLEKLSWRINELQLMSSEQAGGVTHHTVLARYPLALPTLSSSSYGHGPL